MQPAPPEPAHQMALPSEHERAAEGPHPHWEAPASKTTFHPWLPDSKSQRPKVQAVGVCGTVGVKVEEKVDVGVRVGVKVGDSVLENVRVRVTVGVRVKVLVV